MIIARFQQRQKGTLYTKGDPMKGFTDKQEAELVSSGHADWVADQPEELPDDSWTVKELKKFMDRNNILYTSDMLKDDLLDKIQDVW